MAEKTTSTLSCCHTPPPPQKKKTKQTKKKTLGSPSSIPSTTAKSRGQSGGQARIKIIKLNNKNKGEEKYSQWNSQMAAVNSSSPTSHLLLQIWAGQLHPARTDQFQPQTWLYDSPAGTADTTSWKFVLRFLFANLSPCSMMELDGINESWYGAKSKDNTQSYREREREREHLYRTLLAMFDIQ